jgi:ribonuclease Z
MSETVVKLKVNGLDLTGVATSCYGSLVVVENFKIAFDYGILPMEMINSVMRCRTMCITHGHPDHCGALHMDVFLRGRRSVHKGRYLMPPCMINDWVEAFDAMQRLNGGEEIAVNVVPAWDNPLTINKKLTVVPLQTIHRVPSVGYVLKETRSKLLSHLVGKENKEIVEEKKAGKPITQDVVVYPFAYTGDSTIEGILQHPEFLQAEVLMMECTILDDEVSPPLCKQRGHVHLDDIINNLEHFQNKHVVLCHFSPRYAPSYIKQMISTIKDDRFTPFL